MDIAVFDDFWSLGHFVIGLLTAIFPVAFILFFAYELLEFIYKFPRKEENIKNFVGDLFEFLIGVAFAKMFLAFLGI